MTTQTTPAPSGAPLAALESSSPFSRRHIGPNATEQQTMPAALGYDTLESGTAIGVDYGPDETRAVAIHEAGHAVTSHIYMQDTLSTRLSVRMRGSSPGHHAIGSVPREQSCTTSVTSSLVVRTVSLATSRRMYAPGAETVTVVIGLERSANAAIDGPLTWSHVALITPNGKPSSATTPVSGILVRTLVV